MSADVILMSLLLDGGFHAQYRQQFWRNLFKIPAGLAQTQSSDPTKLLTGDIVRYLLNRPQISHLQVARYLAFVTLKDKRANETKRKYSARMYMYIACINNVCESSLYSLVLSSEIVTFARVNNDLICFVRLVKGQIDARGLTTAFSW